MSVDKPSPAQEENTMQSENPMSFFSENVDDWGAAEWFDRAAKAIRSQDKANINGDDIAFETYRMIAASSLAKLVREHEDAVRAALSTDAEPDGWICEDEFTLEPDKAWEWEDRGLSPKPFYFSPQQNAEPVTGRNDEAGYVEFLNEDVPYVVRDIEGRCAILVDLHTRKYIGYRVYDPDSDFGSHVSHAEPVKTAPAVAVKAKPNGDDLLISTLESLVEDNVWSGWAIKQAIEIIRGVEGELPYHCDACSTPGHGDAPCSPLCDRPALSAQVQDVAERESETVERMVKSLCDPFPSGLLMRSGGIDDWRDIMRNAYRAASPASKHGDAE